MTDDGRREKLDIAEHWDWAAPGYQNREIDYDAVEYGSGVTEDRLGLLDGVAGRQVLEVGCGGAETSIALAKRGADCVGVDISREQLAIARSRIAERGVDVDLLRGDIENLAVASGTQDLAISVHAFQWAQDVRAVFEEVFRVLRDDGVLVFSTTHPYFDCLSREGERLVVERPYYRNRTEGEGYNEGLVLSHPRVGDAVNWLVETGFTVDRVEEPNPADDALDGSDAWDDEELGASIPPLVVYRASK